MSKSSNWESTIKPIVVLSVISLIASLLLALVNGMTAPVIAENTKRTTLAAYVGVLPSVSDASELEEVTDYTTAGITGVVKAPDGSTAIKEFCDGFPKAEVLNEALCNARVEDIEALNVPKILGVSVVDGKWSILKEYVEGKTLQQLMDENPDKLEEYMEGMVDLHLLIHKQACPLLNKLKEKTIRALKSVEQLDDSTRYELMTRLDGMPKHTKLCHGDFNPTNIIVGDDGKWYVIDWVHASQGNASADVARTYLLLSLKDRKRAELYMDLFCEKTGTEKRYVQGWLPVVAAAQLAYKRPEEKELLESWINVFEYQ